MATLTHTITQELLDAVGDPGQLDGVLKQYSHSKGPLYHALAQATTLLTQHLSDFSKKNNEAERKYQERQQQIKEKERQLSHMKGELVAKTKELAALDKRLDEKKGLIEQAEALAGLGFRPDELSNLHNLLVQLAASQAVRPEEAVGLFFQEVGRYQNIVSLELEAKRAEVAANKAKAEAERWQAESKAAEAKCKARKVSIDLTEKLLARGIKESDLPQWTQILAKGGISPENMAEELQGYASLEALIRERRKRSNELKSEVAKFERQVKALKQEQTGTQAAIQELREKELDEIERAGGQALAEVQQVGQNMIANLKDLEAKVQEFGALKEQLGDLRGEAALARAFRTTDPEVWGTVKPQEIAVLLSGALIWAQVKGFDPLLVPPETIQQRTSLLTSYTRVHFTDLVRWCTGGLVTEDRKALIGPPAWQRL